MRWRRTPCDHSALLAELETLRAENAELRALRTENARLKVRLAVYEITHWMHSAIVQRDRQPFKARHRVCGAPTELVRRHR